MTVHKFVLNNINVSLFITNFTFSSESKTSYSKHRETSYSTDETEVLNVTKSHIQNIKKHGFSTAW